MYCLTGLGIPWLRANQLVLEIPKSTKMMIANNNKYYTTNSTNFIPKLHAPKIPLHNFTVTQFKNFTTNDKVSIAPLNFTKIQFRDSTTNNKVFFASVNSTGIKFRNFVTMTRKNNDIKSTQTQNIFTNKSLTTRIQRRNYIPGILILLGIILDEASPFEILISLIIFILMLVLFTLMLIVLFMLILDLFF